MFSVKRIKVFSELVYWAGIECGDRIKTAYNNYIFSHTFLYLIHYNKL